MGATTGPANTLLLIAEHAPERLDEAKQERDKLIGRVLELNLEIARLETAIQVTQQPAGVVNNNGNSSLALPALHHG